MPLPESPTDRDGLALIAWHALISLATRDTTPNDAADKAYQYADAMLKKMQEEQPKVKE